jgi:hypothetical protein
MDFEVKPLTDEEAEYIGAKLCEYVGSVAPAETTAEEEKVRVTGAIRTWF